MFLINKKIVKAAFYFFTATKKHIIITTILPVDWVSFSVLLPAE